MLAFSEDAIKGMPTVGIRSHMDYHWMDEFGYIKELSTYVSDWIESIDTSNIECKKKELLNSRDMFLNFNYTDVLERIYKINNVLHIHGGVESICDTPPILGHCDKEKIEKHKEWAKECDDKYLEAEASIQDAVANYLEVLFKNTDDCIRVNSEFFSQLTKVNKVIVFGWSAGEADFPYLRKIKECAAIDAKWIVYYYDDKTYEMLHKALAKEGIEESYAVEYLKAELFWD